MIDGMNQVAPVVTALLLLAAIALSAPSLVLMIDERARASVRLRCDATIGISVLCAGISLGATQESPAVGLLGLACAIAGLLAFGGSTVARGQEWRGSPLIWASAAILLLYFVGSSGP